MSELRARDEEREPITFPLPLLFLVFIPLHPRSFVLPISNNAFFYSISTQFANLEYFK